MAGQQPLRYLRPRYDHHYLTPQQRIPGYLPYANPVSPGNIPVPNASSVDWPQAQFAPEFYPAGHASFSPYVYPKYQDEVHMGDLTLGAEWAEEWRPVGLFLSGLLIGWLWFSPDSPKNR